MILSNFLSVIDNSPVAMKTISTERSILGSILGWVRMIGIGLALIMLTIIALIYLTAESPEKAKAKERLVNYTIGVAVFLGASNLLYFAEQLIEDILKDL